MRTLIVSDGGLLSLLACAASSDAMLNRASESKPDAVWCPFNAGPSELPEHRASARQAGVYGLLRLSKGDAVWTEPFEATPSGEPAVRALVTAGLLAAEHGFTTVVCPWQGSNLAGDALDVEGIARVVDRCLLCEQLISVELGSKGPSIAAPFADLSTSQVADLAVDMAVALDTCWWFDAGLKRGSAERNRWLPLLAELERWEPATRSDAVRDLATLLPSGADHAGS